MKLEDKTIKFKSNPEYYEKEESGLKPNTVRKMDDWTSERRQKCRDAEFIKIVNTETGKHFIRKITDKTYMINLVIISWKSKSK